MPVPSAKWIQTVDEGVYNYTSITNSTKILPKTIAFPLASMYRFNGHSFRRWSVAQHSMLVRNIGVELIRLSSEKRQAAPYLLLHDAHEAFVGDVPAPLKKYMLEDHKFDFSRIERECDARIREDLGLLYPHSWITDLIKEADAIALKFERDAFMPSKHEWVIDDLRIPLGLEPPTFVHRGVNSVYKIFERQIFEALHAAKNG